MGTNKKRVLVTNSLSQKGIKIVEFLKNRNFRVFGTDKYEDASRNKADKFFRLSLLNKDAVGLMVKICRPEVVIYCDVEVEARGPLGIDPRFIEYWNLVERVIENGTKKIVFCPDGLSDKSVAYNCILFLNRFLRGKSDIKAKEVMPKDNLLKTIRTFIMTGGDKENG